MSKDSVLVFHLIQLVIQAIVLIKLLTMFGVWASIGIWLLFLILTNVGFTGKSDVK